MARCRHINRRWPYCRKDSKKVQAKIQIGAAVLQSSSAAVKDKRCLRVEAGGKLVLRCCSAEVLQ
jgi:hypothetical protein